MSDFLPWNEYPPLTEDRLQIVADIIRRARAETLALYDAPGGDNNWSHGCRAYARTCFALSAAAEEYQWLRILPEAERLRFIFCIGEIPFRFYRGPADEPPRNYMEITYAELAQIQLALRIDGLRSLDRTLRLAVETSRLGAATQISLVELDDAGNVTNTYVIPPLVPVADVVPAEVVAVDLPPPAVEALSGAERDATTPKEEPLKKNG